MLVLLNFFRKKITKIYMLIFTMIILIIFTINSLVNYYDKMKQEIFVNNSFILVYSSQDYSEELHSYKNILNIENALFGDIDSELIKYGNKVMFDSFGNIISENKSENPNDISLDDLIINGYESSVLIEDTKNIYKLQDNEILFGINAEIFDLKEDSISKLKNQKLDLIINNNKYEFELKDFYISNYPLLIISSKAFSDISKSSINYLYKVKTNSYENAFAIKRKLEKDNKVIKVSVEYSYDENDINNMEKIDSFLSVFKIIETISLIFVCIISYILLLNIKKDYLKDFKIFYNVGFNKNKINLIFIGILSILFLLSFLFGLISSLVVAFFINSIFNLSLEVVSYGFIFKILFALILLIIIFQIFNKCEYVSQ